MVKRLGKRGDVYPILWVLMELALVMVIFLAFSTKLYEMKNNILFDKIFLSKDIGLMTDAIYASPGDVSYIYAGRVKNFSVSFDKGVVSVYKGELSDPVVFPYVTDSNIRTSFNYTYLSVINGSDVNFDKKAKTLSVSGGNKVFVSDKLGCSEALSTKFQKEKEGVVLDPMYTGKFPGSVVKGGFESNVTWMLANAVRASILPSPAFMTREDNIDVSEEGRLSVTDNKAFSISFILHDTADVNVYVKDDSLKSKKLACLLIDKFSEVEAFKRGAILVSDDSFIRNSNADVSVIVELSRDFPFDDLEKRKEVALKVKSALEEYYG